MLSGPVYFVILDGETGEILARENWIPRDQVSDWGDDYGKRINRNLMAVAYVDGVHPRLGTTTVGDQHGDLVGRRPSARASRRKPNRQDQGRSASHRRWLCGRVAQCPDGELRIHTTTELTEHRLYTPMHDVDYRTSTACENMGYMQATQPSFYIGAGMQPPPPPDISEPCPR